MIDLNVLDGEFINVVVHFEMTVLVRLRKNMHQETSREGCIASKNFDDNKRKKVGSDSAHSIVVMLELVEELNFFLPFVETSASRRGLAALRIYELRGALLDLPIFCQMQTRKIQK